MSDIVDTFFEAATFVADLLDDPETARRWDDPSALEGMTVGGLAAHVTQAVTYIDRLLDTPVAPDGSRVTLGAYVAAMKVDDIDAELHAYIRGLAARSARHGPDATRRRFRTQAEALSARLGGEAPDRILDLRPVQPWVITLEDRLHLIVLELVVHADDLAVSLGREGALPPERAVSAAIAALVACARWPHGDAAVIRALSRRERSGAGVFPVL